MSTKEEAKKDVNDDERSLKRSRVEDKQDSDDISSAPLAKAEESTSSETKDEGAARSDQDGIIYHRFAQAQKELESAQKNMDEILQEMRSLGLYPPDCLLHYLSSGDGSPILSAVLRFLSIEDVGRCEMTCKFFQRQAKQGYWACMAQKLLTANPNAGSPSAVAENDPRKIVIHHYLASTLAERIGGLGDSIKRHLYTCARREQQRYSLYEDSEDEVELEDMRVSNPYPCTGCDFPDRLDFGICRCEIEDEKDYELYVRFSRTVDNAVVFAEGFLPAIFLPSPPILVIELETLDVSNWPAMTELWNSVDDRDLLETCMQEITATVVVLNNKRLEATLLAAQCNFAGEEEFGNDRDSGIDWMGDGTAYCWPFGTLASRSHEDLATVRKFCRGGSIIPGGMFSNDTIYSNAKLGMLYDFRYDPESQTQTDDLGWSLRCHYELRED